MPLNDFDLNRDLAIKEIILKIHNSEEANTFLRRNDRFLMKLLWVGNFRMACLYTKSWRKGLGGNSITSSDVENIMESSMNTCADDLDAIYMEFNEENRH